MITLPNGNSIDLDMLETAMEDSDLANRYFLNLVTGEVVFLSDHLGLSDEDERLLEEMAAPADEHAAEKLFMALNGKGAFHRFKDTLHRVDDQWLQAWYQWRNKRLKAALDEWLK